MADIYAKVQGIADKQLRRFKQGTVHHIAVTAGGGSKADPADPVEGVPTLLPGAVAKGVPSRYLNVNLQTGRSLAQEGDLIVTSSVVAGVERIPDTGDKILLDGVVVNNVAISGKWRVVSFLPIPPIGVTVVWKFIVRK